MRAKTEVLHRFKALVGSGKFPLAEAALVFAEAEYPGLGASSYIRRLDEIAAGFQPRVTPGQDLKATLVALGHYLFDEWGFRGNREEYYDPRNSYLNEVLDRLVGIPITLSLIYIEVGQTLGLSLHGVAFPSHFLVGAGEGPRRMYVDVFNGGRILSLGELLPFAQELLGPDVVLPTESLGPIGPQQFLTRMLNNLKAIYIETKDYASALATQEFILTLNPLVPAVIRDRGLLLLQVGRSRDAARDLRRYLSASTSPEDRASIQDVLRDLEGLDRMYR